MTNTEVHTHKDTDKHTHRYILTHAYVHVPFTHQRKCGNIWTYNLEKYWSRYVIPPLYHSLLMLHYNGNT